MSVFDFLNQFHAFSYTRNEDGTIVMVVMNQDHLFIGAEGKTDAYVLFDLGQRVASNEWKPASFCGYYDYCPKF